MNFDYEYTLHPFEEREFRDRFLPAVQGDEPIVRELLDAADASGPSWTALHKMFDEAKQSLMISLDEGDPDGEGGPVSRLDLLEDDSTEGPVERVENQELKTLLAQHVAGDCAHAHR